MRKLLTAKEGIKQMWENGILRFIFENFSGGCFQDTKIKKHMMTHIAQIVSIAAKNDEWHLVVHHWDNL